MFLVRIFSANGLIARAREKKMVPVIAEIFGIGVNSAARVPSGLQGSESVL